MQKFFWFSVLFFIVCIILAGSFSTFVLIYCALISVSAAAVTVFLFGFSIPLEFHPVRTMFFFLVVLKSVYVSAFKTIFLFITSCGSAGAELQDVPLKTKNSLSRLLLCQGITLTPGTVSVNIRDGVVTVLKFTGDSLSGVHEFDDILRGIQGNG